jgi:hypothetical protein
MSLFTPIRGNHKVRWLGRDLVILLLLNTNVLKDVILANVGDIVLFKCNPVGFKTTMSPLLSQVTYHHSMQIVSFLVRGQNIRDTQHPEKMKSLHPPFNHMDPS